jgi:signal transduction histidine kinase
MAVGHRFVLLWLLVTCAAAGAAAFPEWHTGMLHKGWTREDGAPDAAAIAQDHRGMLWMASRDGLFRFDGVRFERVGVIDGHAVAATAISTVAAIGEALWLGYGFGGISVFEHGAVRHYTAADGIPERSVRAIRRTPDGTMWCAGAGGLFWRDGQRWRHVDAAAGVPAGSVAALEVLPDGSLLAALADGLYRNAPGAPRFRRVAPVKAGYGLYPYRDGQMLVAGSGRTVYAYHPDTNRLEPLALPPAARDWLDVFADRHGAVWVGTAKGLLLLNRQLQVQKSALAPHRLTGRNIFAHLDDSEGNLWIATDIGIDRLRAARVNAFELPADMSLFPSVAADIAGNVWIGSLPTTERLPGATLRVGADGRALPGAMRRVSTSATARDGSLWFAAQGGLRHQTARRAQDHPLPAGLRGRPVQALAVRDDGGLWISVPGRGVFGQKDGVWEAGGGYAALAANPAIALHVDGWGSLWFGYPKNRLAVLERGEIRRFGAAQGLQVGNVLSFASRTAILWVGGDEGLAYFDGERFRSVRDGDGNAFHGVSGIVETARGELWLHESGGLARIAAADVTAAIRDHIDRLPVERFNHLDGYLGTPPRLRPSPTLVEAADGRIWYASTSGVGWLRPDDIRRGTRLPLPQVTALRSDAASFEAIDGVRLSQGTGNLQIDYTAATLGVPERVRFRFRLLGQDRRWRDVGTRRQAFFTNLDPGDYQFEVMAINADGLWSTQPAALAFRIEPTLVQTAWFRIACALLGMALLHQLYRLKLKYATSRIAASIEARQHERERIARTLHDTFLQSVQALIMCFDRIKHSLPAGSPAREQIDAALDNADAVLDEGRSHLLHLRARDDDRHDLSVSLVPFGQRLTGHQGMAFGSRVFGAPRALNAIVHDEALTIGKEAIFNAVRHSGAPAVSIELVYDPACFFLHIQDRGTGIDAALLPAQERAGHWGLSGMRERASHLGGELRIDSGAGCGTTISLRVPASVAYRT